jgi:biliverdin reductase
MLNVGIVGTGYAAKMRAETMQADGRSQVVAVAGRDPERASTFAESFGLKAIADWRDLVQRSDLDLVVISTINQDHGAIAHAALEAGKHVVVEYPLALEVAEAEALVELATAQQRLLHVEHIELLSGIQTAIATVLSEISTPFYVRYASVNPQRPAPDKWTYQAQTFGFPLVAALSRVNRLLHLFGLVESVSCQSRFVMDTGEMVPMLTEGHYRGCMCMAQMRFTCGLIADLVYGKGETLWLAERSLAIHGDRGLIQIDGDQGLLVLPDEQRSLDLGSRRGLFAKDTQAVLDHLTQGTPLYTHVAESLYALKVADAMRQSAQLGQTIQLVAHPG